MIIRVTSKGGPKLIRASKIRHIGAILRAPDDGFTTMIEIDGGTFFYCSDSVDDLEPIFRAALMASKGSE